MQAIQKSPSLFRTLTQSVFDPHAADFWLQKVNPIWSTSRALAQIVKKTSCKRYDQFNFANQSSCEVGQAGQHHPVKVKIDGRLYERSYSLTERNGDLILTVKKVADGKVSTWLWSKPMGDIVELGQPYGDMQLDDQQNVVLLAAGSGITPMYSLIEQLKRNQQLTQAQVKLLYC
jgi:ferredoxin-NADP reductase